ncbi:MAG: hypothetical protein MRZ41_03850 [Eubacterium sp.]|nr:hypothetical protein [Eubacterium sp.]
MNSDHDFPKTPLSRFLDDDNITVMEQLIPYCPSSLGRILAINIKIMELQKIITDFHEGPLLRTCGLNEPDGDLEAMLRALKGSVSKEKAAQINSILQMMQFSRLYQKFSAITKEHPELFSGITTQENHTSSSGSPEIFSDPSLFFLLSSLMNNEENQGEKMKKVMEMLKNQQQ